jgi:hypothetical protein
MAHRHEYLWVDDWPPGDADGDACGNARGPVVADTSARAFEQSVDVGIGAKEFAAVVADLYQAVGPVTTNEVRDYAADHPDEYRRIRRIESASARQSDALRLGLIRHVGYAPGVKGRKRKVFAPAVGRPVGTPAKVARKPRPARQPKRKRLLTVDERPMYNKIRAAGRAGLTGYEAGEDDPAFRRWCRDHGGHEPHRKAHAILRALRQDGLLVVLAEERQNDFGHDCQIYVHPDFIDGRTVVDGLDQDANGSCS